MLNMMLFHVDFLSYVLTSKVDSVRMLGLEPDYACSIAAPVLHGVLPRVIWSHSQRYRGQSVFLNTTHLPRSTLLLHTETKTPQYSLGNWGETRVSLHPTMFFVPCFPVWHQTMFFHHVFRKTRKTTGLTMFFDPCSVVRRGARSRRELRGLGKLYTFIPRISIFQNTESSTKTGKFAMVNLKFSWEI
jgi:hypothetical protein